MLVVPTKRKHALNSSKGKFPQSVELDENTACRRPVHNGEYASYRLNLVRVRVLSPMLTLLSSQTSATLLIKQTTTLRWLV